MPTLVLICGLPGAGKTTLAKQLEAERPALRLTADEWMERIVGDGYNEAKRAVVEAVQWELATRVLRLGVEEIPCLLPPASCLLPPASCLLPPALMPRVCAAWPPAR